MVYGSHLMGKHVLFKTGIRRLGSKESGFFYRYPHRGDTVREERVLRRIENMKVPPGWEEVRIARKPSAKVQAVGYDSAGRLQYLYHPKYRERKEREKFERILSFSDPLPEMRRVSSNHLRHKYLDREKVLESSNHDNLGQGGFGRHTGSGTGLLFPKAVHEAPLVGGASWPRTISAGRASLR
jgi:hypothetical protein